MGREDFSSTGCVFAAHGQIDLYSVAALKTALLEAIDDGITELVVDLSDVDFIDSTGLGLLVGVSKRLRLLGGKVAIVTTDETIRKIFEIAGLTSQFEIYDGLPS